MFHTGCHTSSFLWPTLVVFCFRRAAKPYRYSDLGCDVFQTGCQTWSLFLPWLWCVSDGLPTPSGWLGSKHQLTNHTLSLFWPWLFCLSDELHIPHYFRDLTAVPCFRRTAVPHLHPDVVSMLRIRRAAIPRHYPDLVSVLCFRRAAIPRHYADLVSVLCSRRAAIPRHYSYLVSVLCFKRAPCLESQGCHLIPLCYLLSCSSA